jgi:multiple antibiotic resistance protein
MAVFLLFLKAVVLIPLTLLPIINPLSGMPVFTAQAGHNPVVVRKMARQIAINCWFILVASILVGHYVLDFFGISLAIVRIGGGILVAASGWRMLNNTETDVALKAAAKETSDLPDAEIARRSFFPITFPLTTGPGAIATAIALGAHAPGTPFRYVLGVLDAVLGAAITALVIYLCYRHAPAMLARLGEIGSMVMMRFFAFILLCIGIEIIWTGWASLNKIAF